MNSNFVLGKWLFEIEPIDLEYFEQTTLNYEFKFHMKSLQRAQLRMLRIFCRLTHFRS